MSQAKVQVRAAEILLVTFLTVSAFGVGSGSAVPCVPGAVASIASTSCSIGDLQFTFGTLSIRDDARAHTFSTSTITFASNATNPLAPGFTLTGDITQSRSFTAEGDLGISGVRVTTLNSLATIAGLSASVTGTTSLNTGGLAALFCGIQRRKRWCARTPRTRM